MTAASRGPGGPPTSPHTIVVDLGYGDAGKGAVVDRLSRTGEFTAVVRFNGGAQAAHNVVTEDGRHHTFAQFGSGTLRGVPGHLSRFTCVDPLALAAEADHLRALGVPDPYGLLTVDRRALLTTPYHAAANRLREQARGAARHGSCGMGVGETTAYALAHPRDAPTAGDCASRPRLLRLLRLLRDRLADELGPLPAPPPEDCVDACTAFARTVTLTGEHHLRDLARRGPLLFEGAQGVLLDEWHGFHPYTTWSTTTFAHAETLLEEAGDGGSARRLGVVRTFTTRHGPGPLVTEDPELAALLPEPHNGHGRWQGAFRVGHFDAVAHGYAVEVCGGVDALAVTHLDAAARVGTLRICRGYGLDGTLVERLAPGPPRDLVHQAELTGRLLGAAPAVWDTPGPDPEDWTAALSALLGAPVLVASSGPARQELRDLRSMGKSKYVSGKGSPLSV
ncbi:adenylosuccinate synthetase [Actinacidiphila rubida]|uniref:Adenylosuccinate synthetase n=1 Tax=Actinacidiphila rubida TaxID=310780 RepID=A0A1H8QAK3_9ACTN|nr:adenylosuccinate synthetase [Actinacidiphila rubida]SEO51255.1 adenylosuccinate synthase [Actinacidiphila rubida]